MLLSLLLLAAAPAAPAELGTSPLVAADHQHAWIDFHSDEEGTGWFDNSWHSQAVDNGRPLELILLRMVVNQPDSMTADMILAVDCERDLIGIKDGWVYTASFANNVRLPIPSLTMDFGDNPPSPEDRKVIDFACRAKP